MFYSSKYFIFPLSLHPNNKYIYIYLYVYVSTALFIFHGQFWHQNHFLQFLGSGSSAISSPPHYQSPAPVCHCPSRLPQTVSFHSGFSRSPFDQSNPVSPAQKSPSRSVRLRPAFGSPCCSCCMRALDTAPASELLDTLPAHPRPRCRRSRPLMCWEGAVAWVRVPPNASEAECEVVTAGSCTAF